LAHAVGVAVDDDDVGVVQQHIQEADNGGVLGQEPAPIERLVGGDAQGAAFVGDSTDTEQQLGSGIVDSGAADFVDDDQVLADRVSIMHQTELSARPPRYSVSGQHGSGEVADLVPAGDRCGAEGDQQVPLPVSAGPDQTQVLTGGDPFQEPR
jgi:hypothetical protein